MNDTHRMNGINCEYKVGNVYFSKLLFNIDLVLQKCSKIASWSEIQNKKVKVLLTKRVVKFYIEIAIYALINLLLFLKSFHSLLVEVLKLDHLHRVQISCVSLADQIHLTVRSFSQFFYHFEIRQSAPLNSTMGLSFTVDSSFRMGEEHGSLRVLFYRRQRWEEATNTDVSFGLDKCFRIMVTESLSTCIFFEQFLIFFKQIYYAVKRLYIFHFIFQQNLFNIFLVVFEFEYRISTIKRLKYSPEQVLCFRIYLLFFKKIAHNLIPFLLYFGLVVLELVLSLAFLQMSSHTTQRLVTLAHSAQLESQLVDFFLFLLDQFFYK